MLTIAPPVPAATQCRARLAVTLRILLPANELADDVGGGLVLSETPKGCGSQAPGAGPERELRLDDDLGLGPHRAAGLFRWDRRAEGRGRPPQRAEPRGQHPERLLREAGTHMTGEREAVGPVHADHQRTDQVRARSLARLPAADDEFLALHVLDLAPPGRAPACL